MRDSCKAAYHDFIVVNWFVTPTSRQARELLCNNCLLMVDLSQIRAESCVYKHKDKKGSELVDNLKPGAAGDIVKFVDGKHQWVKEEPTPEN